MSAATNVDEAESNVKPKRDRVRIYLAPEVAALLDDFVTPDRTATQVVNALIVMAHRKRFPTGVTK